METREASSFLYENDFKRQSDDELSSPNDVEDALLGGERCEAQPIERSPGRSLRKTLPWLVHFLSISLSVGILLYAKYIVNQSQNNCVRKLHEYSPVLQAVDDDYETVRFNGTIRAFSPYKGPPSAAVLDAWEALTNYGSFRVTASDIKRSGASPNSVQYPESAGGGYIAVSEGVHQQHCLFILWQDHYITDIPEKLSMKSKDPQRYEDHYEHCVDYLRQKLACNFDTGFLPFSWVKDNMSPLPNFSTRHKCVNGDRVKEWLLEQGEITPMWENLPAPDDAVWQDEA